MIGPDLSVQDSGERRVESDGTTVQVEPVGVDSAQTESHSVCSGIATDADVGDELTRRAVLSD